MPTGFRKDGSKLGFQKGFVPWNTGNKLPKWIIDKMVKSKIGKKHSEETKRKIGLANKGKIYSNETKNKIRIANLGKKYSKEVNIKKGRSGEDSYWWKGGITKNWNKYMQKSRLDKLEKVAGRKRPEFCEICNKKLKICFDHDHLTNKFRGWICVKCNSALGMVGDDVQILQLLIEYLVKSKTQI